ncbi:MAG: hypothetical protein K8T20_06270, partial [Planctomycetes bacterium]|nr:hypothetical protein [Planctomycetota bacterium]
KLCDFGFARLRRTPGADEEEAAFGTMAYASPEQMEGATDLDSRADLYGVGATLFHLATGRMPPVPDKWGGLPAIEPAVSREVRWIVQKLMVPDRGERYGSAEDLLGDLESLRKLKARTGAAAPKVVQGEFHWEFN